MGRCELIVDREAVPFWGVTLVDIALADVIIARHLETECDLMLVGIKWIERFAADDCKRASTFLIVDYENDNELRKMQRIIPAIRAELTPEEQSALDCPREFNEWFYEMVDVVDDEE